MNPIKKYQNLAFVDIETTGLDNKKDRVIEVGIVKIDKDGNVSTYSQLINPGFKISKEIRELTGIKHKELVDAPQFAYVMPKLQEWLKVDLFIAHNSRFDYEFLAEEFARHQIDMTVPHLDTVKLARTFYPNYLTYNLDSIITRLKVKVEKRHRGLDDAQVLVTLFNKIKFEFGEEDLHATIDKLITLPKSRVIIESTQVSLF